MLSQAALLRLTLPPQGGHVRRDSAGSRRTTLKEWRSHANVQMTEARLPASGAAPANASSPRRSRQPQQRLLTENGNASGVALLLGPWPVCTPTWPLARMLQTNARTSLQLKRQAALRRQRRPAEQESREACSTDWRWEKWPTAKGKTTSSNVPSCTPRSLCNPLFACLRCAALRYYLCLLGGRRRKSGRPPKRFPASSA